MTFDESSTKIIIGIIGLLTVIVTGAFISIKIIRKRNTKNTISNVHISGQNNKIVGGDDKSINR